MKNKRNLSKFKEYKNIKIGLCFFFWVLDFLQLFEKSRSIFLAKQHIPPQALLHIAYLVFTFAKVLNSFRWGWSECVFLNFIGIP